MKLEPLIDRRDFLTLRQFADIGRQRYQRFWWMAAAEPQHRRFLPPADPVYVQGKFRKWNSSRSANNVVQPRLWHGAQKTQGQMEIGLGNDFGAAKR